MDLYEILTLDGQFYLPALDDCNMQFMRDALAGKKQLIKCFNIRTINLPRLKEFNCGNLYQTAMSDQTLARYLPDPTDNNKIPVTRRFLLNVSGLLHNFIRNVV